MLVPSEDQKANILLSGSARENKFNYVQMILCPTVLCTFPCEAFIEINFSKP